jgi:hypothetical protein
MNKRNETLKRAGRSAAGVLTGLTVVTPVFAATLDVDTVQPLILLGSLIVLLIGYVLKTVVTSRPSMRANPPTSPTTNSYDLRRRGTNPVADIAMPAFAIH